MDVYMLACPSCEASVPADDLEWVGEEGHATAECPACGATSPDQEWVEAEAGAD